MPSKRGFALFAAEKLRSVSSKGGKAAHRYGNAHEYTVEEAREAGRKGGAASAAARRLSPRTQDRCSICREPGHRAPTCESRP